MTLKEIELTEDNHFIAMEYYGFILNRTFLVLITKEHLIGLKVNGQVSSSGSFEPSPLLPLASALAERLVISSDLENPYSYVKGKFLQKFENLDVNSEEILKTNSSNFKIHKGDITNVNYDPTKKWGMGEYPHNGKVNISTKKGSTREFIILGRQWGEHIAERIEAIL